MATSVFEEIDIIFYVQRGCPQKGALLLFIAVCIIGKCAHNEMWDEHGINNQKHILFANHI